MAQPKPQPKKLQNDHNCASTVDSYGYSANHSASPNTDHEILVGVGLAEPTTEFSSDQSGKIVPLFPQLSVPSNVPQHIRNIESLTVAELKKAYPKEHNSWRSRRDYAQKAGIAFHPPWKDFRAFLREHGPIPVEGYTLDKMDRTKGYIPGNTRWASKKQQTHNRSNTVLLTYEEDSDSLGSWAKRTEQAESTLRWRKKQDWPDENIITGIPPKKTVLLPSGHPWPAGYSEKWELSFQRETSGHADRFWYMAYLTAKRLRQLSAEADSLYHPDDYTPTSDEAKVLDKHVKLSEYWSRFWRHVQRVMEAKKLAPFCSPDEPSLRNWQ